MKARVAIVGGGISGLAAAGWLELDHHLGDLVVLEAAPRAGGKVASRSEEGFVLESGPQGFLDRAPDTLELAGATGLEAALVRADEGSAARFIVRDGALHEVPTSPLAFLGSGLLGLGARLRVLAEALARRRPEGDESVLGFATRRIGRQAAEILVDAMVTGVFAGDPARLSLAATFPRMAAMEAEHGSLTRALVASLRAARREGRKSSGPAGPGGTLTTFAGGMGELPAALARRLGDRLRLGAPVERIERAPGGFTVAAGGDTIETEALLLALPAAGAARLLDPLAPAAVAPLEAIESAPIAVVMSAYADPTAFGRPLAAFGFLVPGRERLGILGTLYCHSIFPGQAPAGRLFLRTMLGGARDRGVLELGDEQLLDRVRTAHRRLFDRDPDPDRLWIVRWERGIAQYTLGHLERVAAAETAAATAGIELTGSSYHGVSVNDCIARAREAAARLVSRLAPAHDSPSAARRG